MHLNTCKHCGKTFFSKFEKAYCNSYCAWKAEQRKDITVLSFFEDVVI
jgi:hypothetical protein